MNVAVVLGGVATLAWVATIVVIGLAIVRASRGQAFRSAGGLIAVTVIVALLATTAASSLQFVQPTQRGIVISALVEGIRPDPLRPGLNWIIPYFENVVYYDITRQTYTMSIAPSEGQITGDDSVEARTSDGQIVLVDASVIFAINPEEVVATHIKWEGDVINKLVRPVARGVIRDGVSQFGIEEVYSSQRFALAELVRTDLAARFEEGGLILYDFVLRNIAFSDEYATSVEQKQIAEQRAQEAQFVVEQRRQEAEQRRQVAEGEADAAVIAAQGRATSRLIEAEAEAAALRLLAAALAENPDLLTFEYIQKLAPGIQVMLVPNDSPFLLPLPSLDESGTTPTTPPVTPGDGGE
jgi:regulator of protease activity HflC (stomatin/prohibitin superfamily)